MISRLSFAVAITFPADIYVFDEVLAVVDSEFQARCLEEIKGLHAAGRTVIFVSHNRNQVAEVCERVFWLEAGVVRDHGPTADVLEAYEREHGRATAERPLARRATAGPYRFRAPARPGRRPGSRRLCSLAGTHGCEQGVSGHPTSAASAPETLRARTGAPVAKQARARSEAARPPAADAYRWRALECCLDEDVHPLLVGDSGDLVRRAGLAGHEVRLDAVEKAQPFREVTGGHHAVDSVHQHAVGAGLRAKS